MPPPVGEGQRGEGKRMVLLESGAWRSPSSPHPLLDLRPLRRGRWLAGARASEGQDGAGAGMLKRPEPLPLLG